MIPDVRLERARGNVARVWLAIWFDFILLAAREFDAFLQVRDGLVELTHRDVSMPAMPVEPCVDREALDALRERRNRVLIPRQIALTASDPDQRIRTLRILRECGLGVSELLKLPRLRVALARISNR